jgi:hypothetical protein
LCVPHPFLDFLRGQQRWLASEWTCPASDDALLLLVNSGRPASLDDLLGLKAGHPGGFAHLSLAGRGKEEPRTTIGVADMIFDQLVLWTDADQNGQIAQAELESFGYLGFEKIVLPSDTGRSGAALRGGMEHAIQSTRFRRP